MKLHAVLTAAALLAAPAAFAQAPQAAPKAQEKGKGQEKGAGQEKGGKTAEPVKATLKDANGKEVGTVTLTETPHGVLVQADLMNLPAGEHAIHIHEAGKCDAPDFKTAGGHLNVKGHKHGILSAQGKHEGDLPNFTVGQDGKAKFDAFANTGLTMKTIQDKDGAAIVVHAKQDDYKTDPAGDAGGRIACGVVGQ